MPVQGLISVPSHFGPKETMDRIVEVITAHGITVFTRIDHAAGAAKAGMDLRPTEVVIFGNPQAGTPLMQAAQTTGIDLPLKILVWQDAAGQTWLAYNDPAWLAERHGVAGGEQTVARLSAALASIAGSLKP